MHKQCISPALAFLLPNLLTALRLCLAPLLLFVPFGSIHYIAVYTVCGITDALDGKAARALGSASRFGNALDSISDLCFVLCSLVSILPGLSMRPPLMLLLCAVILMKLLNLILGLILYRKYIILHTLPLKCTGLMLFFLPLVLPHERERYPMILCVLAFFAAFYSTCRIITGDIHDE